MHIFFEGDTAVVQLVNRGPGNLRCANPKPADEPMRGSPPSKFNAIPPGFAIMSGIINEGKEVKITRGGL